VLLHLEGCLSRTHPFRVRCRAVAAEVESSTESPTIARQHDDTTRSVDSESCEGPMQIFDQFRCHRVETFGSVQFQNDDTFDRTLDDEHISFRFRPARHVDVIL
jgi:hypothetical protein